MKKPIAVLLVACLSLTLVGCGPSAPVVPPTSTITVPAGGDLQAALESAACGATVTLEAGATFTGNYLLPAKTCDGTITVRTAGALLEAGVRLKPEQASTFAKLTSPTNEPALRTAPGAHHWAIQQLEISGSQGDIVRLGDPAWPLDQVPHDLTLAALYIHGDATLGAKRGISANSATTTIRDSYISDIKVVGQDSQAISGWSGTRTVTITNNYLEAAGENILFGGADSLTAAHQPQDIRITGNTLSKPLVWRGQGWSVKNLLELKAGIDVTIDGNILEHVWADGQVGYAVLFTVRNQDGRAPWSTIANVVFSNNLVRHMGNGIQILGRDDQPGVASVRMRNVVFENNRFVDIDPVAWGGISGKQVTIIGGPIDLQFLGNTFAGMHLNSAFYFSDVAQPTDGLIVRDHTAPEGLYGIMGDNDTPGRLSLEHFAPGAIWERVTFGRTEVANRIPYPEGTTITTP